MAQTAAAPMPIEIRLDLFDLTFVLTEQQARDLMMQIAMQIQTSPAKAAKSK